VRLSVRDLTVVDGKGVTRVDKVGFDLRAGEILGVAGVSGNGQSELLEALSGHPAAVRGRHRAVRPQDFHAAPSGPAEAREHGLAHVPEDRLRLGVVTSFPAWESFVLGYHDDDEYNGRILMDREAMTNACGKLMERFDVRPRNPDLKVRQLLRRQPAEADPGAGDRAPAQGAGGRPADPRRRYRRHRIHPSPAAALRDAGCAILLVSVELDEIMS
jgi:simple sugar transport system ATP-binding protein